MILGPTMPDIEILFNTDTKTIGLSYVSCNVGFIGGALFSGVVIDRFNQELIFGLSGILSAVVVGASTYMGSVVPFIIAFGVTTFSNGLCDSGMEIQRLHAKVHTCFIRPYRVGLAQSVACPPLAR